MAKSDKKEWMTWLKTVNKITIKMYHQQIQKSTELDSDNQDTGTHMPIL